MKLALLKGNRFNPWHLGAFNSLRGNPEITAFRAESEIQAHFHERDDNSFHCTFERIYFDTEVGYPWTRLPNAFAVRYLGREPRIAPFHDRLEGFDLIQSWELFTDWTAEAIEAREKFGIPLAVMVWDNIPFNMERNPERRRLKRRAAESADLFMVHTERSRRALDLEGVPSERIVHINPGVDTEVFCPGEADRKTFGLSDEEFIILFVGWLLPRKGVDFLVLALRELVRDEALHKCKFRLMVVGSGPGMDRVERLIDRLDLRSHCTFVGALPYNSMPQAFRAADVFVLPSIATPEWQEQFGMTLLEAMACGIPVVSTYTGAIPEIAGDAAILCQPNDFVALYDTIKHLVLNLSKRIDLGAAGRERALKHYTSSAYAQALSGVYDSLLSK